MAKNYENVRVYGDLESEVYLAPKGSVLPTTMTTDPIAPYSAVGWISEDGVSLGLSTDVEKFKGWQGGTTLRTKVTSAEKTFTMQALEETPGVLNLFYGTTTVTVSGTAPNEVAKVDIPESPGTVQRAAVIKFVDGDVEKWLCCENVQVTERGDVSHANADMTMYEFTFEIIGASYLLTNAPAFTE